jgi:hypothetical protein
MLVADMDKNRLRSARGPGNAAEFLHAGLGLRPGKGPMKNSKGALWPFTPAQTSDARQQLVVTRLRRRRSTGCHG